MQKDSSACTHSRSRRSREHVHLMSSGGAGASEGPDSVCSNSRCSEVGSLRCGGCQAAWYCTAGCQKAHWLEHRDACAEHQACARPATPPFVNMQERRGSCKHCSALRPLVHLLQM
jgi:hypothetical protein